MNTVQLECFMEVAATLNFSRAAENLRMTQPAVSHQINSLEAELGTKLFNRTSKSVELTRDGIRFIGPASDALKILNTARTRIKDKSAAEVLPLGIVCREARESRVLPPVIESLCAQMPRFRPVVRIAPFMPVDSLAENETADVIFSFREDAPARSRIVYKELKRCRLCCVCAPSSPLAAKSSLKTAELHGENIALIQRQRSVPEIYKVVTSASATLKQSQIFLCDSYDCARPLVAAGLCYCVMPELPAKKEEGLEYIPISDSSSVSFGIYYSTLKTNPVLKSFVETAVATLR